MAGNLILIRGLPGSGKTTMAKELLKVLDAVHVEADMYWLDKDGNYNFDPKCLHQAHSWCQTIADEGLSLGRNIIVSNTFTTKKEMKPYLNMDYDSIAIFEAKGKYKSIHNVPKETIKKMKDRWVDLYESD